MRNVLDSPVMGDLSVLTNLILMMLTFRSFSEASGSLKVVTTRIKTQYSLAETIIVGFQKEDEGLLLQWGPIILAQPPQDDCDLAESNILHLKCASSGMVESPCAAVEYHPTSSVDIGNGKVCRGPWICVQFWDTLTLRFST